jgi:hypothetical protein
MRIVRFPITKGSHIPRRARGVNRRGGGWNIQQLAGKARALLSGTLFDGIPINMGRLLYTAQGEGISDFPTRRRPNIKPKCNKRGKIELINSCYAI